MQLVDQLAALAIGKKELIDREEGLAKRERVVSKREKVVQKAVSELLSDRMHLRSEKKKN